MTSAALPHPAVDAASAACTDPCQNRLSIPRNQEYGNMQTLSPLGAAALTLASLTPTAALAGGPQAVSTAAQHAGFAAGGADLASARRHLHHTRNCLVGPDGEGF